MSRPSYNELTDKGVVLILSTRSDIIADISEKVYETSIYTVDAVNQYLSWKICNIGGLA